METNLKPCPFCGNKAEITNMIGETEDFETGEMIIKRWKRCVCINVACIASLYNVPNVSEDAAVNRWNKRSCECQKS